MFETGSEKHIYYCEKKGEEILNCFEVELNVNLINNQYEIKNSFGLQNKDMFILPITLKRYECFLCGRKTIFNPNNNESCSLCGFINIDYVYGKLPKNFKEKVQKKYWNEISRYDIIDLPKYNKYIDNQIKKISKQSLKCKVIVNNDIAIQL